MVETSAVPVEQIKGLSTKGPQRSLSFLVEVAITKEPCNITTNTSKHTTHMKIRQTNVFVGSVTSPWSKLQQEVCSDCRRLEGSHPCVRRANALKLISGRRRDLVTLAPPHSHHVTLPVCTPHTLQRPLHLDFVYFPRRLTSFTDYGLNISRHHSKKKKRESDSKTFLM